MLIIIKCFGVSVSFSRSDLRNTCLNSLLAFLFIVVYVLEFLYVCNNQILQDNRKSEKVAVTILLYFLSIFGSNISTLVYLNFKSSKISTFLIRISKVDRIVDRQKLNQIYRNTRSYIIRYYVVGFTMVFLSHVGMYFSYYFYSFNAPSFFSECMSLTFNTVMAIQCNILVRILKTRFVICNEMIIDSDYFTSNNAKFATKNRIFELTSRWNEIKTPGLNIQHLRRMYFELYHCVQMFNSLFGFQILMITLSEFTIVVVTSHFGSYTYKSSNLAEIRPYIVFIYLLTRSASVLFLVGQLALLSQQTSEEVNKAILNIHKLILFSSPSYEAVRELENLQNQLKDMKIEFSVCGFFTLNMSYFCAFMSGIVMYALILVQLQ